MQLHPSTFSDHIITMRVGAEPSSVFTDLSLDQDDFIGGATTYNYENSSLTWEYSNSDSTTYSLSANLSATADTGWTYSMTVAGIGTSVGEVSWTSADTTTAKTIATGLPQDTTVTDGTQTLKIEVVHANFTGGDHNRTFVFTFS